MITGFYALVFGMSVALLCAVLLKNKRADTTLVLAALLICINCFGRALQASSESLETALLANHFIYVGACYIPLLIAVLLSGLCGFKMPRLLKAGMITLSTVIFAFSLTVNSSTIFYRTVQLKQAEGYSYLEKEYGPGHHMFVAMMILYGGLMLYYVIFALRRRKKIAVKTTMTISLLGFSVFSMYILEQVLELKFSILTVGYLVGIAFLARYYERITLYDMSANIASSVENRNDYAYLMLDDRYLYVNANALMKELFPEIEGWQVDRPVPETDTMLYRTVVAPVINKKGINGTGSYISQSDKHYLIEVREIPCGKKDRVGYLIELADRTIEKKYYNAVEEYNSKLQDEVEKQTVELKEQQGKIKKLFLQTVAALSEAVDAKDRYTSGHSRRVAEYARLIAARMGKSESEQEEIFRPVSYTTLVKSVCRQRL